MGSCITRVYFCIAVGLAVFASAVPAAGAYPSADEIHLRFSQGKYRQVLHDVAMALALRDPASRGYDEFDMLTLKAESHLRLRQAALAIDTFATAAKKAPDLQSAAVAYATGLLLQRADNFTYIPLALRSKEHPEGQDVIDPEKRKAALALLADDEISQAGSKLQGARETKKLPPILEAGPTLAGLRKLETAAGMPSTKTDELTAGLAGHAREIMEDWLRSVDDRIQAIEKSALEVVEEQVQVPDPKNPRKTHPATVHHKRGLSSGDVRGLADAAEVCNRVVSGCKDVADALSTQPGAFDATLADASRLHGRANEVLQADYRN